MATREISDDRSLTAQVRTYYAENPDVDVLIHTDHLDDLLEYELKVDWVARERMRARFGTRPELADATGARGNLVEGTFCERVFQDCSRSQVVERELRTTIVLEWSS